jgi:hypothetical protein
MARSTPIRRRQGRLKRRARARMRARARVRHDTVNRSKSTFSARFSLVAASAALRPFVTPTVLSKQNPNGNTLFVESQSNTLPKAPQSAALRRIALPQL